MKDSRRQGFTLAELIIVVSILALLAGVLLPRVSTHLRTVRDQRRLSDIKSLQKAIEQYYLDNGDFPVQELGDAGWDESFRGEFIPVLVHEGYLSDFPKDPTNDNQYYYQYRIYNTRAGSGCGSSTVGNSSGHYYVLRIKAFEDATFAAKYNSTLSCGGTDWSTGFAYVVGGGAKFE